MKRLKLVFIIFLLYVLLIPSAVFARSKGYHSNSHSSNYSTRLSGHKSTYSPGVKHEKDGHIVRSSAARKEFMRQTGYPHGRPGDVIDHIVPLKRGGADSPSNMQWQTKEAAKIKDKTE